ncbi:Asparaginyl-tRNA synthetase [Acidilobus saccharovorans 345-15]|uniref:Asparagine--tRNA ligase n=1 Tax=Acidilobus saccharovorans (strain DSM 16705 / JCM 18335 / VKM B-2471 / 345-15) TaxID=666510 RepID=D9Q0H9_ACIS3|nr:Asparaginyl-tRNA synthetase [Acidilobus saccharovorans 345-15]
MMSVSFMSSREVVASSEGSRVKLRGWVYRKRDLSSKIFIVVRDSEGIVQCVVDRSNEELSKAAEKVTIESSVEVEGVVRSDQRAPGGKEVNVERLNIVGLADDFPIKGGESVDYLLDIRHLWLRSRRLTQIMRIRATVLEALRNYFISNGWWEVSPPILTQSAVEGGATLFPVDFFGRKAYLSQSAQFYLEVMIFSLERVWSLTPSFRAERSRTRRHLYEYWHLEGEAAWMDMHDMMKFVEGLVKSAVKAVLDKRQEELQFLRRNQEPLEETLKSSFEEVTYDEAIERLQKRGFKIKWGDDIGADEEKALTQDLSVPFFLTMFPKHLKSFYMKTCDRRPEVVLGFDLEAPEGYGEVVGGSQREDRYDVLLQRIKESNLNPDDYQWYLDLRRYGSVPHSGFGLGVDRLVMWIAGLDHIRDSIPFPRLRERIYP